MTITIPDDLAAGLKAEADRRGMTPEAVALERMKTGISFVPDRPPGSTAYDRWKSFIGSVDGPADLSQDTGKKFADGLHENWQRTQSS
jgi:hypothetical protein